MPHYVNRRTVTGVVLMLLLGTFLPPLINVSRLSGRVAEALSRALGRPVSIGAVHLRVFPRPGLDLERLVVQDDPAISAEPVLHADQVTASLRLASLWRGRLEIASLSLAYPSLNLVRSPNGHWNLESLLERARQIPTAPTTKRSAGMRPRFPYIEANGGRINLKLGAEKTVYALSDADFALSSPSENAWQLNVSGRPIRTDANLSDTGRIRITGTLQRAATLSDTPLNLRVELTGAQLGQMTTLIYGRDRGWRGTLRISGVLKGMPSALNIAADGSVDDFRRYDIATPGSLRLAARCSAAFSTITQQVTDMSCHAPVGSGEVEVHGGVAGLLPVRDYSISVLVKQLPARSLVVLAQRMKKDLPDDMQAGGSVDATIKVNKTAEAVSWKGTGSTKDLLLSSGAMSEPLELGQLQLAWGITNGATAKRSAAKIPPEALRVSTFPLDLGAAMPTKAQAWFGNESYSIDVQGDAKLNRLLEVAHAFGVRAPHIKVSGVAAADLHVSGSWTGFAQPVATGNLHLRSVTATIPGIAAPLQVTTAAIHLAPDAAAIYDLAGAFAGTHLSFTGSFQLPRVCPKTACPMAFQVRADQVSTDELNRLLNPRAQKRSWYDILGGMPQLSLPARLDAVGKVTAARLDVKTVTAKRVSADLRLQAGVLTVRNLKADVLGGSTVADLDGDFTGAQPIYSLKGTLQQASVGAIAALTHGAWGTGHLQAKYVINASGWDAIQLRDSATASIILDWRDGSLTHLTLAGAKPLKFGRFQGELALSDGQLTFKPSKMETPWGIYVVSGTASLDRQLELKLMRNKTEAYEVTGTVDKPSVTPALVPETQRAAMKP